MHSGDLPWHHSPFGHAAIDYVIDFAAAKEPHKQGSSANVSTARCTHTLVKYLGSRGQIMM